MRVSLLVIGGGLSGLAAAIRAARFNADVLVLEKHHRPGGLNSYFYRNGTLYETGLHAITNYAEPQDKKAPLNRLLRQLKLTRNEFSFCRQLTSEILFRNRTSLRFSNEFGLFESEINSKFPLAKDHFQDLLRFLDSFDPFTVAPFRSAKKFLLQTLTDPLLVDMILCPLMYYGSSMEGDIDLSQFAIMFQAIYREGMFRPEGTIKDFLDQLVAHYQLFGGALKTSSEVDKILHRDRKAVGVLLKSGEVIECDYLLSTIGLDETRSLLDRNNSKPHTPADYPPRLGFFETIYQVAPSANCQLPHDKTIIFYNDRERFSFEIPEDFVDFTSGVICFPGNFAGITAGETVEIRSTHLANYTRWKSLARNTSHYQDHKRNAADQSSGCLEHLIGNFKTNIVYENSFTPVTIERYTAKIGGAIYGSPTKVKDGRIGFDNLFLAGTDQGFLGIIGAMLSGVSMVNQHILPKL